MTWTERTAAANRTAVHAIAVDDYGAIAGWHLRETTPAVRLEGPGRRECWSLTMRVQPWGVTLAEEVSGQTWEIGPDVGGAWHLQDITGR